MNFTSCAPFSCTKKWINFNGRKERKMENYHGPIEINNNIMVKIGSKDMRMTIILRHLESLRDHWVLTSTLKKKEKIEDLYLNRQMTLLCYPGLTKWHECYIVFIYSLIQQKFIVLLLSSVRWAKCWGQTKGGNKNCNWTVFVLQQPSGWSNWQSRDFRRSERMVKYILLKRQLSPLWASHILLLPP